MTENQNYAESEEKVCDSQTGDEDKEKPISEVLADEMLSHMQPPLLKIKPHIKELILKQNKIYVDISAEKFNFLDSGIHNVENMMERVKFYREKLIKVRRQMIYIHHRTKLLKNRSTNLQKVVQDEKMKQEAFEEKQKQFFQ